MFKTVCFALGESMKEILMLIKYCEKHLNLNKINENYFANRIASEIGEDNFEKNISLREIKEAQNLTSCEALLSVLYGKAKENNVLMNTDYENFCCKIMDILTKRPEEIRNKFKRDYAKNKRQAFINFHKLCVANYYIKTDAISKNIKWSYINNDKSLEITVNLSKPEKNNKETAKKANDNSGYPKCMICSENEGYCGHGVYRQNLRIIPINLGNEKWFFQYSPYAYFDEHLIAVNECHTPMKIDKSTFIKLLDFVDFAPFYFIGCNACLPIVGGSILAHDHFQGGFHDMPLFKCGKKVNLSVENFSGEAYVLNWYNSVLCFESFDRKELEDILFKVTFFWENYSDLDVDIICKTDVRHNAVTPIVRKDGQKYIAYLILRNNRTNELYPEGIFHAHKQFHNIKSEAIGLIEAMGHFILPPRLKSQVQIMSDYLTGIEYDLNKLSKEDEIQRDFISKLLLKYGNDNDINRARKLIKKEISIVCENILINTAVFKDDESGRNAFNKFLKKGRLL